MNFDPVVTMNSVQIAELVGSRHDDVKRSIARLAEKSVISLPPLAEVKIQRERREETAQVYLFSGEQGKRDSIVVVAQLSPEFTARLVDRWQELEQQAAKPAIQLPDFTDPEAAARAWADEYAEKKRLAIENAEKAKLIEEQQPAVEFARAVQASDESISMGQLAKLIARQGIDIGERRLRTMLKEDGYLMKSGEPYQRYTEYFEMVVREWVSDSGRVHTGFTVRITPKGERYFLKRYGQKPVQVERKPNPPKIGLFKPRTIKE
ncbi:phage antirepressor KilAC domain-containing protein [Burkholderia multivorans]|uniref:phage antirepressor KilAC domain-containing protein n=1 Tax=Burkholderia multivorans TaxID=87883 RepID=UPI0021C13F87|nr:phage antirepressor KilAC domain-containing protein [Burkholderia multivorans]